MIVYTDGNGTYYEVGNTDSLNPTLADVNVRTMSFYTTKKMTGPFPLPGWSVAPGLSDIGSGVWADSGQLVDPPQAT